MLTELSLNCPTFYKDSVASDIIQSYCANVSQKCLIFCNSTEQLQKLALSPFLKQYSLVVHSQMNESEGLRVYRDLMGKESVKCVMSYHQGMSNGVQRKVKRENNTQRTNQTKINNTKIRVKLVIFVSPPPLEIYQQIIMGINDLQYIVVIYTNQQMQRLCQLQLNLNYKLHTLIPPQVSSDQEIPSETQTIKKQIPKQNTLIPILPIVPIVPIAPLFNHNQNITNITSYNHIHKIVIKNLPLSSNNSTISKFFSSKAIEIKDISTMIIKPQKKMAFVTCLNLENFKMALKLDGSSLHGSTLLISEYNKNKKKMHWKKT